MKLRNLFCRKNFLGTLCFFLLSGCVFAEDWILGTEAFTFKQTRISSTAKKASSVLPNLILEQIASRTVRTLPESEILDRKLDKLHKERIDLFLQLSKENQARDSLVITKSKPEELALALEEAEKRISEIEKKIDENLEKNDKEVADYEKSLTSEKEEDKKRWWFPFPFFRKDEQNRIVSEKVSLYKNITDALFEPSEYALSEGRDSYTFSKEVMDAKINGLMTGAMSTYGDYVAVTVEIFVYPGARSVGAVTEVGSLSDIMSLSKRVVQKISPKIANSLPVLLEFAISPSDADAECKVAIDGVVRSDYREKITLDSGIHTISIESPGYNTAVVTYNFVDEEQFLVKANLSKKIKGIATMELKEFQEGFFYTNALEASPITEEEKKAKLSVNGKSVLGVFSVTSFVDGEEIEENAFYRISDGVLSGAEDAGNLNFIVDAKPFDRQKNIDKRRRGMYMAYSLLICSLPYTFYNLGTFTSANKSYDLRGEAGSGISRDDLVGLQTKLYVSLGITGALGAWTIFELVRYLRAADQVLPAEAKEVKNPDSDSGKTKKNPIDFFKNLINKKNK